MTATNSLIPQPDHVVVDARDHVYRCRHCGESILFDHRTKPIGAVIEFTKQFTRMHRACKPRRSDTQ